ncbi:MAG: ABC transporter substrate-binding protein [Chloroflexi bacterium]|nr:ABC transporter substrate-binding protein [Chloroflexota bacterium]
MSAKTITVLTIVLCLVSFRSIFGQESTPSPYLPEYPITVESCGEPVTFAQAPSRAISFDTNMTEIMLALGLEDSMVGYWISGVPVKVDYQEQIANVPLISDVTWPPPGMETIVSYSPDFVFGAWNYNFSEEWGVTPEALAEFGVTSYVLSESCITVGVQPDPSLERTYQDILNIGLIFGVEDRAQTIVSEMRANIQDIQDHLRDVQTPLRAMYYGGGSDAAFSAGRYAMPTLLLSTAGAINILGDIEDDWIPEASWETIISLDPEVILIDDTPWESAEARIATLKSLPQLADVTAVREERFVVVPWTYVLPGIDMDEAIAFLAHEFHPERFE